EDRFPNLFQNRVVQTVLHLVYEQQAGRGDAEHDRRKPTHPVAGGGQRDQVIEPQVRVYVRHLTAQDEGEVHEPRFYQLERRHQYVLAPIDDELAVPLCVLGGSRWVRRKIERDLEWALRNRRLHVPLTGPTEDVERGGAVGHTSVGHGKDVTE